MTPAKDETSRLTLQGLADWIDTRKASAAHRRSLLVVAALLGTFADSIATSLGMPGLASSITLYFTPDPYAWQLTAVGGVVLPVKVLLIVMVLLSLANSNHATWSEDLLAKSRRPLHRSSLTIALVVVVTNLLVRIMGLGSVPSVWRFAYGGACLGIVGFGWVRLLQLSARMPIFQRVAAVGGISGLITLVSGISVTRILGVGDRFPHWNDQLPLLGLFETVVSTILLGAFAFAWTTHRRRFQYLLIEPNSSNDRDHCGEAVIGGELLPPIVVRFTPACRETSVVFRRLKGDRYVYQGQSEFELCGDIRWIDLSAYQQNVRGAMRLQDGAGVLSVKAKYSSRFEKPAVAAHPIVFSLQTMTQFFRYIVANPDIDAVVRYSLNRRLSELVESKLDSGTPDAAVSVEDLFERQSIELSVGRSFLEPPVSRLHSHDASENQLIRDFIPLAMESTRLHRLREEAARQRKFQADLESCRTEVEQIFFRGAEILKDQLVNDGISDGLRILSDLIQFQIYAEPKNINVTDRVQELRQVRIDAVRACEQNLERQVEQVYEMHAGAITHVREDAIEARKLDGDLRRIGMKKLLTEGVVTTHVEQADHDFLPEMFQLFLNSPKDLTAGRSATELNAEVEKQLRENQQGSGIEAADPRPLKVVNDGQ